MSDLFAKKVYSFEFIDFWKLPKSLNIFQQSLQKILISRTLHIS